MPTNFPSTSSSCTPAIPCRDADPRVLLVSWKPTLLLVAEPIAQTHYLLGDAAACLAQERTLQSSCPASANSSICGKMVGRAGRITEEQEIVLLVREKALDREV